LPADSTASPRTGVLPRALLITGISFCSCVLARLFAFGGISELLLWPAAGLALGFGWRYGLRWIPFAGLGAAGWALMEAASPVLAIAAFLSSTAGPYLAIRTVRRIDAWKPSDTRLEAMFRFVAVSVLIAAPIDAAIAGVGLMISGAFANMLHPLLGWWLIDTLGLLLLAPAVIAWDGERSITADDHVGAFVDVRAAVLSMALLGFSLLVSILGERNYGLAVLFFYFPIVAWTSVRSPERTTAYTLLLTALPLLATRSFEVSHGGADPSRAVADATLMLSAVLLALILQAIAADRRQALLRMAQQAHQDLSTGLLNDRGLLAELGERLISMQRSNYGLIGVHVGNFDTVHDMCGPIQALQLEQSAALLLLHQPGTLHAARLSSGRFALLIAAETVADVRALAREVYVQLNGQVYKAEHGSIRLQASVGGLLIDQNVLINSEDCLVSLSDAMAIAASVRDPQLFVEPLSQTMIDARRSHQGKIEHIREAIREHRLEVYAQPIEDPDAPEGMLSYEVLTRLRGRDGTLIRPPEFLPLAIQAQLTVALDRGVIRKVFGWLAENPEALRRTHKCSLNLSGLTMSDGAIAGFVREQRALHRIPAEKVVFEITESEAIRNPGAASRLVDDLKAEGFGIALDDFGTGLATFEYLKRFPLDYLKIDGSFIRNLVTNPIDEEIVLSTVRVARRLNVKTIAEHVHSQAICDRVRSLGVEYIQGEVIGTAIPIAELFDRSRSGAARADAPKAIA
jgi:EAL domain-containing protein (putative c-di-GMP-specific phosphodiesterase class I)/GGDEF domain-containing protein